MGKKTPKSSIYSKGDRNNELNKGRTTNLDSKNTSIRDNSVLGTTATTSQIHEAINQQLKLQQQYKTFDTRTKTPTPKTKNEGAPNTSRSNRSKSNKSKSVRQITRTEPKFKIVLKQCPKYDEEDEKTEAFGSPKKSRPRVLSLQPLSADRQLRGPYTPRDNETKKPNTPRLYFENIFNDESKCNTARESYKNNYYFGTDSDRFRKISTLFQATNEGEIAQLNMKIRKLESVIQILNLKTKTQDESSVQISQLRKKLREQEFNMQKLMQDNMNLKLEIANLQSDKMTLNSQVNSLNSTIDSLNESLKDKDNEIERVQDIRADLNLDIELANKQLQEKDEELFKIKEELLNKDSAVYIAHKSDDVDQVLARFLKNYPEKNKLRVLFLRETDGQYRFGTQRVYLSLDHLNEIQVRIGSGLMHIDDFLNQFSDIEASKITRKNEIPDLHTKQQPLQKIEPVLKSDRNTNKIKTATKKKVRKQSPTKSKTLINPVTPSSMQQSLRDQSPLAPKKDWDFKTKLK